MLAKRIQKVPLRRNEIRKDVGLARRYTLDEGGMYMLMVIEDSFEVIAKLLDGKVVDSEGVSELVQG